MPKALFLKCLAPLLAIGFFYAIYAGGKKIKQKWIVHKTLQSNHWKERVAEINAIQPGRHKIIFLGNSLCELFNLEEYFNDPSMLNCGIVGDFTEGLLKRADGVIRLKPRKIFIEIGINDIIEQVPLTRICENYGKLIDRIKRESPATTIYILSNLPVIIRNPSLFVANKDVNERVVRQNCNLKKLAEMKGVHFIDLHSALIRSGNLEDLFLADGIHLTHKAYATWKINLEPYL